MIKIKEQRTERGKILIKKYNNIPLHSLNLIFFHCSIFNQYVSQPNLNPVLKMLFPKKIYLVASVSARRAAALINNFKATAQDSSG